MNPIEEFLPKRSAPTLARIRIQSGLIFLLCAAPVVFFLRNAPSLYPQAGGVLLVIFLGVYLSQNWSVSVVISSIDSTLTHSRINCLGKIVATTVYIPTAEISYEYREISRSVVQLQLRLSNGLFKRVILRKDEDGFTEEQLDKIMEVIKIYQPGANEI